MNKRMNNLLFGKDGRTTFVIAVGILLVTILGCLPGANSENQLPAEFHGEWKADNGQVFLIKPDGTGEYHNRFEGVEQKLTGVTFERDTQKNTFTYKHGMVSTTLELTAPPKKDRMTIGGVVYRKKGE